MEQSIIPKEIVTEHDFSRGPWWPERTVDAVWCVEFTEHVGRNFQPNYLTAFRKAALIFVTHSNWGGWHHVSLERKMNAFTFDFPAEFLQSAFCALLVCRREGGSSR